MRFTEMPAEEYITSFGIINQLYIFIQTTGQRSPALRQALDVVRHFKLTHFQFISGHEAFFRRHKKHG